MKIVYIFRSVAVWGGIERILVDKLNLLSLADATEACLLTYDQGQHQSPYVIAEGVSVGDLGIRFHQRYRYRGLRRLAVSWRLSRLFRKRLRQWLQREQPDVIVCTTADPLADIAAVKGSTPLVVESHSVKEFTFGQRGRLYDYFLRRHLHLATTIVSLTDGDAARWREDYADVRVIPNMVSLNDSGSYSTQRERHVVFVGRMDYQKRVMSMVAIWQRVFPSHQDWTLDIYGDGDDRKAVEAAALRLHMNIVVHDPTDNIFEVYRHSSILALTSLFEPFGLVMPEAMSCGVPVVAYDSYGPREIVTDGVDGFIVGNGDEASFASRLSELMSDESLRLEMGRAAIASSRRYSADRVMPLWLDLFSELTTLREQ